MAQSLLSVEDKIDLLKDCEKKCTYRQRPSHMCPCSNWQLSELDLWKLFSEQCVKTALHVPLHAFEPDLTLTPSTALYVPWWKSFGANKSFSFQVKLETEDEL